MGIAEDEYKERQLRRQWGIDQQDLLMTVKLKPFLQLITQSYKSVGIATAIALTDDKRYWEQLKELERTERTMNYALGELV